MTNYPIGVCLNEATGELVVADNHNNFNLTVFDTHGGLLPASSSEPCGLSALAGPGNGPVRTCASPYLHSSQITLQSRRTRRAHTAVAAITIFFPFLTFMYRGYVLMYYIVYQSVLDDLSYNWSGPRGCAGYRTGHQSTLPTITLTVLEVVAINCT